MSYAEAARRRIWRCRLSDAIIVIDISDIRDGKIEEAKTAFAELVEIVAAGESDPIAYNVYLAEEGARITVMQIHPSSESMERHLESAAPTFRRFVDLLDLTRVDLYGKPSETLLERIRRKAELLGDAPVVVNELHTGLMRFGAAGSGRDRA